MKNIKKGIPSFFTSLGLISGCISIVLSVSHKDLTLAAWFILIAAVFDFIDGFAARLLKQISEFGKQLDSLSDVISFGVAPSMILYQLILISYVKSSPGANFDFLHPSVSATIIMYSAFVVAVFSALRLAKFNLDPNQVKNFRGLPVPANAIFVAGLAYAAESDRFLALSNLLFERGFLVAVIIVSSFLLVSNVPMFSLKMSSLSLTKNLMRYIFLVLAGLLLVLFGLPGLAPVIILYIMMSVINTFFVKME